MIIYTCNITKETPPKHPIGHHISVVSTMPQRPYSTQTHKGLSKRTKIISGCELYTWSAQLGSGPGGIWSDIVGSWMTTWIAREMLLVALSPSSSTHVFLLHGKAHIAITCEASGWCYWKAVWCEISFIIHVNDRILFMCIVLVLWSHSLIFVSTKWKVVCCPWLISWWPKKLYAHVFVGFASMSLVVGVLLNLTESSSEDELRILLLWVAFFSVLLLIFSSSSVASIFYFSEGMHHRLPKHFCYFLACVFHTM